MNEKEVAEKMGICSTASRSSYISSLKEQLKYHIKETAKLHRLIQLYEENPAVKEFADTIC
jgi:hypothetical protein